MKITFLDVETTGLDPETDELIEVCVMVWDDETGAVEPSWSSRFMPHGPCGAEAAAINGYDPQVWANSGAPHFDVNAAVQIADLIKTGGRIAGTFGLDFLQAAFRRVRCPWPKGINRMIDLGSMAMPLVHAGKIERNGLDHIAAYFGLGPARHNACDDVALVIQCYERLCGMFCAAIPEDT